jgi:hypothetical protein
MPLDLDTFLVAVYAIIDEWYQQEYGSSPPPRGRRPVMSDSEVLALALLAQWRRDRSERALLRYVDAHWRAYFPHLLSQSAFNRRVRGLEAVLGALGPRLAQEVTAQVGPAWCELLDGTAVPLLRRCRGERGKCFGPEAAIGRGGVDRDWYYGLALEGAVSAAGALTGYVLAPANTEARWQVEALLRWRVDPTAPEPTAVDLLPVLGPPHRGPRKGPTGPLASPATVGVAVAGPYVGDRGLRGVRWQAHWQDELAATVLTSAAEVRTVLAGDDQAARPPTRRGLWRVVEAAFGALIECFGLRFPRARTYPGVRTRVAAKVAAYNLALRLNQLFGRQPSAFLNPFD